MRSLLILFTFLLTTAAAWGQAPLHKILAGRNVAIWQPIGGGRAPLVLFSHGYTGINSQSAHLMSALAQAGYLVVAPNHRDYLFNPEGQQLAPQQKFEAPETWTEDTYRDRAEDLAEVYRALASDATFKDSFDPDRLVLMGHSLGGYTILGLTGGWPGWERYGLKPVAIVCLAPYLEPYLVNQNLSHLRTPVLFQVGTEDLVITPYVTRKGGAYDQAPAPKFLQNIAGAVHSSWTSLERSHHALIERYVLAFLDRYVKGKGLAKLLTQPAKGLVELRYDAP